MPCGAGTVEGLAPGQRAAVHQPYRRRAVAVLPVNIGFAVAIETARSEPVPRRPGIEPGSPAADEVQSVHFPDHRYAVVVLPQNVGLAVAVEIACAFHVPG